MIHGFATVSCKHSQSWLAVPFSLTAATVTAVCKRQCQHRQLGISRRWSCATLNVAGLLPGQHQAQQTYNNKLVSGYTEGADGMVHDWEVPNAAGRYQHAWISSP